MVETSKQNKQTNKNHTKKLSYMSGVRTIYLQDADKKWIQAI